MHIVFHWDCSDAMWFSIVTSNRELSLTPIIFMAKFWDAAPRRHAFRVAVAWPQSQPCTSASHQPGLSFNREGRLSQKEWMSPHSSGTLTLDTVRVCAFSLTCSCLNCLVRERRWSEQSVSARGTLWGTLQNLIFNRVNQECLIQSVCPYTRYFIMWEMWINNRECSHSLWPSRASLRSDSPTASWGSVHPRRSAIGERSFSLFCCFLPSSLTILSFNHW